ncbi:MAG: AAC(3) family N-acetyltransferase [Candidatus Izemoplasmatales bacterium]|nr:AAC(3) family N-acetyltransferase [Candidatus Izemoplasmatales bacterium]
MYKKLINLIDKTKSPITQVDFINAYKELGIKSDSCLEVHSSVSSFGYIINKEYDICDSLIETITDGVVIMMAHNGEFSDPSEWINPPVPKEWHLLINENRRVFDKDLFIPERVGKVAQLFCKYPGVTKTNNPITAMSVLNNTDDKSWLNHDLDERKMINPLYKLIENNSKILFVGTGFNSCTSIHLTEHLSQYSILKEFSHKRLNEFGIVENAIVITKYIDDEFDNFKVIEDRYVRKYKGTDFLKEAHLGLGKLTLIDSKKLFEIAKDVHLHYRK